MKPARRRELAKKAVSEKGLSIRQACRAFVISENCYRFQPRLRDENAEIADWLLRLTQWQRNWGFGLCFCYLRNVKGFSWNHKQVYRIYRELELNLRIKPKKRIVREKPPQTIRSQLDLGSNTRLHSNSLNPLPLQTGNTV